MQRGFASITAPLIRGGNFPAGTFTSQPLSGELQLGRLLIRGGNCDRTGDRAFIKQLVASIRPPLIRGGNLRLAGVRVKAAIEASIRPPLIRGGNYPTGKKSTEQ